MGLSGSKKKTYSMNGLKQSKKTKKKGEFQEKETLTHWGWVTHLCVIKLTIIGSDNGLSPDWRQAIIWTNAGLLLIGPLGTNFIEILIKILTFSFKKTRLKVSAKRWPFCLGLNVLTHCPLGDVTASNSYQGQISEAFIVILPSGECHKTSSIRCQHWYR